VYLVVSDPELRPQRVKIGWTQDLRGRLAGYRVIAPFLQLLRFWPTRAVWMEYMGIGLLRHLPGVTSYETEIFDLSDMPDTLAHLDAAFQAQGVAPHDPAQEVPVQEPPFQEPPMPEDTMSHQARARLGGYARRLALSPERRAQIARDAVLTRHRRASKQVRSESARKAVQARWARAKEKREARRPRDR
jgi:hypothetical protein